MTVTPKTLPLLEEADEVGAGDLFATRQVGDTVDRKQTAAALLAYLISAYDPFEANGRIVTLPGPVTVGANDQIIEIAKTDPEYTVVNILDGLTAWKVFTIKDGGLNAGTYPITLIPASGSIDGHPRFIMDADGQSVDFYSNGTDIRIV